MGIFGYLTCYAFHMSPRQIVILLAALLFFHGQGLVQFMIMMFAVSALALAAIVYFVVRFVRSKK